MKEVYTGYWSMVRKELKHKYGYKVMFYNLFKLTFQKRKILD